MYSHSLAALAVFESGLTRTLPVDRQLRLDSDPIIPAYSLSCHGVAVTVTIPATDYADITLYPNLQPGPDQRDTSPVAAEDLKKNTALAALVQWRKQRS